MNAFLVTWGQYRRVLRSGRSVWIFVSMLILCVSIISSCGSPPSSATAIGQHPQPSVGTLPFHGMVTTLDGDFTITLDITPDRSGTNMFLARVTDTHTHIAAAHVGITLYTTMQDMAMGTDSIILHANGNGQFSTTSGILSMGGHWAIGIAIQTADHQIHKVGVSLLLPS